MRTRFETSIQKPMRGGLIFDPKSFRRSISLGERVNTEEREARRKREERELKKKKGGEECTDLSGAPTLTKKSTSGVMKMCCGPSARQVICLP